MRRTLTIALGTAVALVSAAVAFAVVPSIVGVSEATAMFSTTTIDESRVKSCTENSKVWERTSAHYTGTVSSTDAAVLNGSLAIHARTTYNTTDGLGYVDGSFKIKGVDSRFKGTFSGTIKTGKLVGFLTGKSHGNHAKVLGNLSADFAGGATNFGNGKIGTGSTTSDRAVVVGPVCKGENHDSKSEKPKRVSAEGVATLTTTTISVPAKNGPPTTCLIGTFVLPTAPAIVTGVTKVEMECEWVGADLKLTKLKLHT